MKIIDSHVYCLPSKLHEKNIVSSGVISKAFYESDEGISALSLSTYENICESMEISGINASALVSFPWPDTFLCDINNAYIFEAIARDSRFYGVCSVNPNDPKCISRAIELIDLGAIGIKLNPNWQLFGIDSPLFNELITVIEKKNIFLMLHVDQGYKSEISSAAFLFQCAKTHPGLRILAAHMGGLLGAYELIPGIKDILRNVWYDTAISSTLEFVKFYCDLGLSDKIIFGSDFPFNHSHSQVQLIEDLNKLGINEENLQKILSANFLKLIEL